MRSGTTLVLAGQNIVAGGSRGRACPVVIEWSHAGKCRDDVIVGDAASEKAVGCRNQVIALGIAADALKAGDYFASCGPAFTIIRLNGNMLHVTCSPVDRIVIAAGGHRSFATSGKGMTEARIEISSTDFEFFRMVLTDRAGKQAWLNPYWIDDLGLH